MDTHNNKLVKRWDVVEVKPEGVEFRDDLRDDAIPNDATDTTIASRGDYEAAIEIARKAALDPNAFGAVTYCDGRATLLPSWIQIVPVYLDGSYGAGEDVAAA